MELNKNESYSTISELPLSRLPEIYEKKWTFADWQDLLDLIFASPYIFNFYQKDWL